MRLIVPAPTQTIEPGPRPTFSVVIPAYQAAATIGEAVASVLAQTDPAHEVIIVDDGSTDDLAASLSNFGSRIRLIRKENGGGASALNAGVAAAAGEFLAILDADDVYGPRRLDVLGELAVARPDLDILTTETEIVLEGRSVGRFSTGTPFVSTGQRAAILKRCFIIGESAVRMARLRAIGGFDETLRTGYDWDCWIRLILDGALAGFVHEPHLEYRLQPDSLTTDRVASLWDRVRILEKAAKNPSLSPDERPVVASSLRFHRTRAVLAEAEDTLARGQVARTRFLRYAASSPLSMRARIVLGAAATAPSYARKWIPRDRGPLEQRLSPSSAEKATAGGEDASEAASPPPVEPV